MPRRARCVFGCVAGGASFHHFPNPVKKAMIYKSWVEIILNTPTVSDHIKSWLRIKGPEKVYRHWLVCDHHFKQEHKTRNHRIMYGAVPEINLQGVFMSEIPESATEGKSASAVLNGTEKASIVQDSSTKIENKMVDDIPKKEFASNSIHIDDTDTNLFTWQKKCELISDELVLTDDLCTTKETSQLIGTNGIEDLTIYDGTNVQMEETKSDKDDARKFHERYACNVCSGVIPGFRYTCVQCVDYDMCSACEASGGHPHHYVLRVPESKSREENLLILKHLTGYFLNGINSHPDDRKHCDSLDIIKTEEADPLVTLKSPSPVLPAEGTVSPRTIHDNNCEYYTDEIWLDDYIYELEYDDSNDSEIVRISDTSHKSKIDKEKVVCDDTEVRLEVDQAENEPISEDTKRFHEIGINSEGTSYRTKIITSRCVNSIKNHKYGKIYKDIKSHYSLDNIRSNKKHTVIVALPRFKKEKRKEILNIIKHSLQSKVQINLNRLSEKEITKVADIR